MTGVGTHVLVELYGARHLDDLARVEACLLEAIQATGATLLKLALHQFTEGVTPGESSGPGGVTGIALLSESHVSVHTWPELGYAAVDIFLCGDRDASAAIAVLQRHLEPASVETFSRRRGERVGAT